MRQRKVKKIRELFVQELARIQGGTGQSGTPQQSGPPGCPEITTFACGEEPRYCGGC